MKSSTQHAGTAKNFAFLIVDTYIGEKKSVKQLDGHQYVLAIAGQSSIHLCLY